MSESEMGPISYENWKAFLDNKSYKRGEEYLLFTDAKITGQISSEAGPYQLLNTIPMIETKKVLKQSVVLRIALHLEQKKFPKEIKKSKVACYHAGGLCDEIASLVSLCLGIRLKAGELSRDFDPEGDLKGNPRCFGIKKNPILQYAKYGIIIPEALEKHTLNHAKLFFEFPKLIPQNAVSLILAARFYQDAMWLSESDPELSWLMFVSAIEVIAGNWRRSQNAPLERLRFFKPELEKILLEKGDTDFVSKVAENIVDYMGATKNFVDFIMEFIPEPPNKRPNKAYQISWKEENLRKYLRHIYNWRSKSLHGGQHFPLPMCEPPMKDGEAYHEKPIGLATMTPGAVWTREDTPMLLHMFEYIVRNALLNWWKSIMN